MMAHHTPENLNSDHKDVSQPEAHRSPSQETMPRPEANHYADDEEMTEADENSHSDGEDTPQPEDHSFRWLGLLREELSKENGKTIFACGGSIPVSQPGDKSPLSQSSQGSHIVKTTEMEPVTIRWDPPAADELARHAKLILPLEDGTKENLERLIKDTDPASFGYKGKTTYDETYRKALKMDTTAFATTFDPYALGIIDTIAQVLLPAMKESNVYRAVKAELYKLNIYSAPSGKFKAHVDTPRSNGQFGSLVVCLPLAHEGGQLQVRHSGREFTFDWGSSTDAVSWAAFYSDCEHEVLEVTSGHRITLTYNLYAVRGNGTLAGAPSPSLDIDQLPLYQSLRDVCGNEHFLPNGGHLGFYCSHAYPHTGSEAVIVPDMLKGLDMMVLEAFRRLKIEASVKPVMEVEDSYERNRMYIGREPGERMENLGSMGMEDGIDELIEEWREGEKLDWEQVHWVNEPRHKQVQMSYIAYGNQESLDAVYSYCAIIARLPPYCGEEPREEPEPEPEFDSTSQQEEVDV